MVDEAQVADVHNDEVVVPGADFDPGKYLSTVSGARYLEVKWRVLWLRTVHPDAQIETEMMSHEGQLAIFRARVSIPGAGSATGWGQEQYNDFKDYIEKAETKALGRAIAALGFGTQFVMDDGSGADRPVDSPVRSQGQQQRQNDDGPRGNPNVPISPRQIGFAAGLARDLGMNDEAIDLDVKTRYGVDRLPELNGLQGSQYIDILQKRKASGAKVDSETGEVTRPEPTPAKAEITSFYSKLDSIAEVSEALNLEFPIDDQRAMWKEDLAICFDGRSPDDESFKDDLKMMVGLAADAARIGEAEQTWRFVDLLKNIETEHHLDAAVTVAQKARCYVPSIHDAAEARKGELRRAMRLEEKKASPLRKKVEKE